MDKIVEFGGDTLDFDDAVDEIDILVPKYLDATGELESAETPADIMVSLQNVEVYWSRLKGLFDDVAPLEQEIPFEAIIQDTMQSELATLEHVYMRLNMRIEFDEAHWTKELWQAAKAVLARMDLVLGELGFGPEHEDRMLIIDIQNRNRERYQTWLLRYKLSR